MQSIRSVRLIVPGLLGPVADTGAVAQLLPRLPALERVLARAEQSGDGVAGGEGAVCAAFGIDAPPWPIAAAARQGEPDPAAEDGGWWLRLDPVHLRIDQDHARLFGPYVLGLTADETEGLVARLNDHLAADGLRIEAPAPDRWYLRLDADPDLRTHPLPHVAGRNVHPFLPDGAAASQWRGRLTELQMLLHDDPVNAAREAAGRLPANSVWPWGGGYLPAPVRAPARVRADDALATGLARLAAVEHAALPAGPGESDWPPGGTLVVDFGAREPLVHGEIEGWLEAVTRIDRDWVAPLLGALRTGRLQRLELDPCDGRRFRLGRAGLRRFWRRDHGWHRWLAPG